MSNLHAPLIPRVAPGVRSPTNVKELAMARRPVHFAQWAAQFAVARSQRTQIIRHIAEFPDHRGVAEIAGGRVARAAKCDCTDMAFLA
jgi:hypothetical protein